tara:strand:+ start:247 stop:1335 length:1089 start_codon:yes stop_codon:yes gene_type:complete
VETTKYMTDEIPTENSASVETAVENTNITASDFVTRRLGSTPEPTPTEEQSTEEVVQEEAPEVEAEVVEEQGETPAEAPAEDVLSQLDLDDMSEADLRELSEKLGSRAVARFGELTAKRKAAEERVSLLEAKMQQAPDPLKAPETVANNPFASLNTIEALQEKAEEVNSVIEWAEDTLFQADGYSPEDVVVTIDGQELTKADVRKSLLNSRKSRDKFLPSQLKTVQAKEQGKQLAESFQSKAVEELPWLSGEDNDVRHQYNAIMQDERVGEMLQSLAPDVSAQMPYLMAHAANSLWGRTPVKAEKPASATLNPPKQVGSVSAATEKSSNIPTKAIQKLAQQYKTSGDKSDFIKFRTQQIQTR